MISVIILTKNEENNLPACLESLKWAEKVFIVDSGSTDKTHKIASDVGVDVFHNEFTGFGDQRNWALYNLPLKTEWVLFLDADEVSTSEFSSDVISQTRDAPNDVIGFYCCWKLMLNNRWIKYSDLFPRWQFRLLRFGKAYFENFGHGQREKISHGKISFIKEPYLHFAFSKGWSDWFERHNQYSSNEANLRISLNVKLGDLFSYKLHKRKTAIKYYTSRLPCWPVLRFIYGYILKKGFLDGIPGFIYSINMSIYEYFIQLKMNESKKVHNSNN